MTNLEPKLLSFISYIRTQQLFSLPPFQIPHYLLMSSMQGMATAEMPFVPHYTSSPIPLHSILPSFTTLSQIYLLCNLPSHNIQNPKLLMISNVFFSHLLSAAKQALTSPTLEPSGPMIGQ